MGSNIAVNLPRELRRESTPPRYRWRAIIWFIFGLIILSLGIYFGPQTVTYCRLRPLVLRPPDSPPRGWNSLPRPLPDTTASAAEGSSLSYYGYRFEVPWKDVDTVRNEGRWVEVQFKTRQVVTFTNPDYLQQNPINIHGDAASGLRITQSEINRIIQSFGPSPGN
jgi:hypothetical protein